jgi:hypothetical protein
MRLRGRKRGATLVLVALSMTVLLGFMAFAVDLSQMTAYRSELQRAVDAGAHAGAIQLTKARYDSAAAVASSFTAANVVFGKPPVIDAIEYGTWNGTAFAPICAGLGCDSATVKGANAIRISAHGAGSTIFAGILGALGFSVNAKATGWAAPVTGTNCLKPITLPYTTLTSAINARLGLLPGNPAANPLRVLTDTDLAFIRGDSLSICLVQFLGSCGSSLANVTDSLRLNLPLGLFLPSLASDCDSASPLDALSVLLPNLPLVGGLLGANDTWCTIAGGSPCALKVALSENVGVLGSRIRMIGSIVIDSASDLNVSAHFSTSIDTGPIDTGPIGTESGLLYRPVLVQ